MVESKQGVQAVFTLFVRIFSRRFRCHTRSSFYGGPSGKNPMDQNADSVAKSPGSNSGAPQRMVYCVHGRPSNCCVSVLNNQNNADAVSTIILDDEEDHCHRERKNKNDKKARRKLWFASILCLVFMICEIVGK
ncbi:uncharacterized protein LOC103520877 isoform X1 [Diaphorina citri]|uniref:Uncharacterized protein LOC103520877 isoform X1 n=1 Tax=Diaphorina citri TaxID=121845 RepID=A0A3Q0JGV2_DIACI|nr:uncharacterized protein LOC103520877 isoform X1 [Diaphorina citri]